MPISRISDWLRSISENARADFLTLMMLMGLLPGLQDYSIFLIDFGYPPGGSPFYQLVIGLSLLCVPIVYGICHERKNYLPFLATAPLMLLFATWLLPIKFLLSLFHVSSVLAYGWFIWRGGMRNRIFGLFLVLVWIALSTLHLLLFLGISLIFRSIVQLVRQNWTTVQRLGWKRTMISIGYAALLWSPMLLVVLPSYWLSEQIEEKAAEGIYAFTFLDHHTEPRLFKLDLDKSLDSLMLGTQIKAARKIDSLQKASADLAATAPKAVGDLIRNSIVPPRVKKIDLECKWYRLDCHAAQGAARASAKATSNAFQNTARKLADNTEKKLAGYFKTGDEKTNRFLTDTDAVLAEEIANTRRETEQYVLNGYRLLLLILLLSEIGFFFVVFKSFTYVLARVIFSREKDNTYASLRTSDDQSSNHGEVTIKGGNYHIPAAVGSDFFISRRFEPTGRAPKISIPQPGAAFLARFFNGCYAMNRVKMGEGRSAVDFNAAIGIEFVEWELAEGESVVFRLADFVGISEGVQLKRSYSLRMESLLLGHIFFTTATGPGKLILRSKGNVILTGESRDESLASSVPQHRLIAWQQTGRFYVESELNIADVFFSGVYLRPFPQDVTVINSDQTGKAKSGIGRFFWHFLLPN